MKARTAALGGAAALLAGCEGVQSALAPAGREAEVLYEVWWVMIIGAALIWAALNGAFFWFTRFRPGPHSWRRGEALILGGGVGFPTLGLIALLAYTLPILGDLRRIDGEPQVRVVGEQWWWRVHYLTPDGAVVSANELRLPAGRRTLVSLGANEVIHSFWIPSLSGKLDMFPGRETLLPLEPTRAGVFRGQCAELCGDGHALMAFPAMAMEPDAFDEWLRNEGAPARAPADDWARRGLDVFLAQGCPACHTIRGTPADGRFGPDLTHVAGRATIGAGTLPNTPENMALWISRTDEIKPGVRMPAYASLEPDELASLVRYLEGLD